MDEEFDHIQNPAGDALREVFDWIESGLSAVIVVILVFTFIGRMVGVVGESMLPTLNDSDRLVSTHLFYTPKQRDIVVVTKPNMRNEPLIKRVIATGGQTLDIDFITDSVYVNGVKLDESYIFEPMYDDYCELEFPLTVPEGHVFVMGDNRNNSWDSRIAEIGLVDERHILGKIVYRVMPYDAIGRPK